MSLAADVAPWKRRQEIPNAQIRDAAEQFDDAWRLLASQQPGTGLLLPILNNAAVALELFLKCLSAVVVHTPDSDFPGAAIVTAKADHMNHKLVGILDSIPADVRKSLDAAFRRTRPGASLYDSLRQYDGLFAMSRYPFEQNKDITQYPLLPLTELCTFLREFIEKMEPIERVTF